MANKPIPFELHQGRKTLRADRHGSKDDRPKMPPATKPTMPRGILGPAGRREWRLVLKKAPWIREVHAGVLLGYCSLYEDFVASRLDPSKKFTAADKTQMRLYAVELGITPSAFVRMRSSE